jgi:hypothetical protein
MAIKYVRRATVADYIADQTVTIGAGGGTDTIEDIPKKPDEALEIEMDDGSVFIVMGYYRK